MQIKFKNFMDLIDRIHELINSKGVTVYEISKDSGVVQSTLSRILRNKSKKPRKETIERLANYLQKQTNTACVSCENKDKEIAVLKSQIISLYERLDECSGQLNNCNNELYGFKKTASGSHG